MRVDKDEFTGRAIAKDALPPLEAFRRAGGLPFHEYSVEDVRRMYVENCEAAPLHETHTPEQSDFEVGAFHVRLYDPRSKTERSNPTAGILFVHGGGWIMGNLRTHHFVARRLSVRTGLPLLAVDYRLAPEHRYPAAIDDCREAMDWFLERDDLHGVRLSSLSLVGDSAGGQLATVLTNEAVAGGVKNPIDSQVLLYPVTDLTEGNITTSASYQRVVAGFPLVAETMEWFADAYVSKEVDRSASDLSPLQAVLPEGLPASYVITVDNDPLAEEGARYAAKLAAAGAPVQYEHLVGYAHGLFTSAGRIPTGEHYVNKAADFIVENTSV
ncbi:alpha/beta hydrolase [Corynebacterium halotolerans]|uniref:Lipase/esterase n=1 Tax=Corynebacterium halotolerans YIM 70093 = DSM 44683 TaxID=1121362 RepID=M1NI74_9CORY|nr:alpha/beta hydrolase [Corynebacterium halotolerans]AGF71103.1 lipase/esterase [Corynebacterium halotolerans YIM 70093 = DSM 44683]